MKYQTQKVAMLYFYGAIGLFVAQILFGVVAATIYVLPNTLSELLPFNIVRMIHTNALVVAADGLHGLDLLSSAGRDGNGAIQPQARHRTVLDLPGGRRGCRDRLYVPHP